MADSGRNLTSFVSWAHSDQTWQKTIATFVFALRKVGITADVDSFDLQQPGIDWTTHRTQRNSRQRIRSSSQRVQPTKSDGKIKGRHAEEPAPLVRQPSSRDLIDRDQTTFYKKVVVVLLPGTSVDDVPAELASGTAADFRNYRLRSV